MEKQQELFGEFRNNEARNVLPSKGLFADKAVVITLPRDKLILSIIGIIAALAAVFVFGFERGRQSAAGKYYIARQPVTKPAPVQPVAQAPVPTQPAIKPQPAIKLQPAQKPQKLFSIQVATFKSKEYAQQEVAKLKKKGYSTTIIGINGLYEVLVGEFSTQKEAEQALIPLKKLYKGCYARKR